jgi:hypothetical protein
MSSPQKELGNTTMIYKGTRIMRANLVSKGSEDKLVDIMPAETSDRRSEETAGKEPFASPSAIQRKKGKP